MKNGIQFSKILTTAFAAVMLPVSVYVIIRCLDLAQMAVERGFAGALPYVTAIVGFVEASVAKKRKRSQKRSTLRRVSNGIFEKTIACLFTSNLHFCKLNCKYTLK